MLTLWQLLLPLNENQPTPLHIQQAHTSCSLASCFSFYLALRMYASFCWLFIAHNNERLINERQRKVGRCCWLRCDQMTLATSLVHDQRGGGAIELRMTIRMLQKRMFQKIPFAWKPPHSPQARWQGLCQGKNELNEVGIAVSWVSPSSWMNDLSVMDVTCMMPPALLTTRRIITYIRAISLVLFACPRTERCDFNLVIVLNIGHD